MTREAPLENAGMEDGNDVYDESQGYESEPLEDFELQGTDDWWLARASSAFRASEQWFDSSVRRKIEDNMRMFNSEHPRGSKYHHSAYSKRSKLVRPKIRTATRKLEAAASAAFFATQDAVSCIAPNPGDPRGGRSRPRPCRPGARSKPEPRCAHQHPASRCVAAPRCVV